MNDEVSLLIKRLGSGHVKHHPEENLTVINVAKDFDKQYKQRFVRYTENKGHPSDFWVFPFTETVENIYSLAVGGYFWYIFLGFIVILLINVLWSLVFTIPGVLVMFNQSNFVSLFETLTFLASLFYIQILDYYRSTSRDSLAIFKESTLLIEDIAVAFNIAFKYEVKSIYFYLESKSAREVSIKEKNDKLRTWYRGILKTERNVTDLLFFMSLFSLRVFLDEDYEFEYETEYGLDKEKIMKLEQVVNKKRISKMRPRPEDFMKRIIEMFETIVYLMPLRIRFEELPDISPMVMGNINQSINNLKGNVHKAILQKTLPEPRNFVVIRNIFVVFWMLVIVPFIAYNSVTTLLPLFGTLVEFLFAIPLINAWFVGKPFVYSGRYAGPDYFDWRKALYKVINYDKIFRKNALDKMRQMINGIIKPEEKS